MNRVKKLRKDFGLTQKELAEKIGLNEAVIGSYELGNAQMTIKNAIKLSRFFGVSIDYLVGNSDEEGIVINNELNDFENNLINELRNLSDRDKMLILKFIIFLNS